MSKKIPHPGNSEITDRAFEVWTRVIEAETGRPHWRVADEHAAFVAGVAEGIRQAREAVAPVLRLMKAGSEETYWIDLRDAIDAIENINERSKR